MTKIFSCDIKTDKRGNLSDKTATIELVKKVDNSKLKVKVEELGFIVKDIK